MQYTGCSALHLLHAFAFHAWPRIYVRSLKGRKLFCRFASRAFRSCNLHALLSFCIRIRRSMSAGFKGVGVAAPPPFCKSVPLAIGGYPLRQSGCSSQLSASVASVPCAFLRLALRCIIFISSCRQVSFVAGQNSTFPSRRAQQQDEHLSLFIGIGFFQALFPAVCFLRFDREHHFAFGIG